MVGGGFYSDFAAMTASKAWPLFGEGNGAATPEQMLAKIGRYRRAPIAPGEDPVIGCVFIQDVCFFPPDEAAPPPPGFSANIVQGKSYDLSQQPAAAYFSDLIERMLGQRRLPGRVSEQEQMAAAHYGEHRTRLTGRLPRPAVITRLRSAGGR